MTVRNLTDEFSPSRQDNLSNSQEDFTPSLTPYSENQFGSESTTDTPTNEEVQQIEQAGERERSFDELLPPTNPFVTESEESSGSYTSDSQINSQNSLLPHDTHRPHDNNSNNNLQEQVGSPYSDYRGYYTKEMHNNSYDSSYTSTSNSNLNSNDFNQNHMHLTPQPHARYISTSQMVSDIPLSHSFIHTPKPFDRYPKVSSTIPPPNARFANTTTSSTDTPIQGPGYNTSTTSGSGSSSFGSHNNGLMEKDFSPFGGYPTSFFPLNMDEKESDDYLHNPDLEEEARLDKRRVWEDFKHMNMKSFIGFVGIMILFLGSMAVFIVLPALTFTGYVDHPKEAVVSTVNETVTQFLTDYEYPQLSAIRTLLVDPDTPSDAMAHEAKNGDSWELVFSDEFNAEGRTFYDGDDQFWTAPDIHYDATKDLEWYTPDGVHTEEGTLKLRMDAYKNHDLFYRSGMVQSWNKFCFSQGAIEISANLPNYGRVSGLWPGLWTMGNLARPGYLASTEGLWPYSYDSCDAGITPNQSSPDGISYLPGQRLSACVCDGEDTPSPGFGRGAPEIDIIEGEVDSTLGVGIASQSLQIAPFDIWYIPDYNFIEVYNYTTTVMNSYTGGPFQQAISAVTTLNTEWYEYGPQGGNFQTFGMEYLNDEDEGYIQWSVGGTPTFTLYATALHPNGNIGWRTISKEPMSIIMNLGISNSWAYIDWRQIFFPVTMSIDYVRVYQPKDAISTTCDPKDFPTYDYIESHKNAYTNANLTSWESAGYTFPLNALTGNCKSSDWDARTPRD
ncbi:beta-glucan synthesis-associated protein Kre6p [Monosporozyma unispora]|nr:hypothetical protein C6P44_004251 [Kazachstania unispora]